MTARGRTGDPMWRRVLASLGVTLVFLVTQASACAAAGQAPDEYSEAALPARGEVWFGDFDAMKQRGVIRVAVPFSRTLFFNDGGVQRGITAENLQAFERWLNRRHKTGSRPITVFAVPTTRERLFALLREGRADIAAGNLTITPLRDAGFDFSVPLDSNVSEVVVTGPAAAPVAGLADLAGREVHVRGSSSYYESLLALDARLRAQGLAGISVRLVPEVLEDEDLMDMVNAGILQHIVVDLWKARLWANVLPGLRIHADFPLRSGGQVGWAFRPGSPLLEAELNEFIRSQSISTTGGDRLVRYARRLKRLQDPLADHGWLRLERTLDFFRHYGERYRFDHLMIAAQGFQESGLNQSARSPRGAIGIMQLMPATAQQLEVGNIHVAEHNIHGGTKYLRRLLERYFQDAQLDEANQTLFALAAYNAGPGRIARLRREAVREGFDPDQWFNHVEIIAAQRIGQETVSYVRNIYKYYIAYRMQAELAERRAAHAAELEQAAE